MDTVDYDQDKFEKAVQLFPSDMKDKYTCIFIPVGGICNIKERSNLMPWFV